jgi:hypothetical protein
MRITSYSAQTFRSRITRVVAMASVISLAACQDVTGPESEAAVPSELRLAQSASTVELASLGNSLDDMTGWSLATLQDNNQRGNIVGVLNGMKGHLKSGNTSLIQQDVTQARGILTSLTDVQQVELGPVTLTLDIVQKALDGGSK